MNVKQSPDQKIVPARRNPFAVEHVTKIPFRFEDGDWSSNLNRLSQLSYRAAIVGPKGSGKTTLLLDLEGRINRDTDFGAQLVVFSQDKDTHPKLLENALTASGDGKILLVDGFERLSVRKKFRLFRNTLRGSGLVVATHSPMRLPPFNLPTWIRTSTSELLLDYILSELQMASPDVRAAGKTAMSKHGGNIRNVLRELYDRHASLRFK